MATSDEKFSFFYYLGFTPCKAEQPLRGMELQEKEAQKDQSTQEFYLEEPTVKRCRKSVENISKNLQNFLEISPVQRKVLL